MSARRWMTDTAINACEAAHEGGVNEVVPEIVFRNRLPAEYLSYLKGVERTDSYTIRYQGDDMVDVSRFTEFVVGYNEAQSLPRRRKRAVGEPRQHQPEGDAAGALEQDQCDPQAVIAEHGLQDRPGGKIDRQ